MILMKKAIVLERQMSHNGNCLLYKGKNHKMANVLKGQRSQVAFVQGANVTVAIILKGKCPAKAFVSEGICP